MDSQIVASVIAVLGTLGGAAVTAWVQRETKKIAALERRVERYKAEIRARQAQEDVAAEWLAELDVANTPRAAKTLLRERTEQRRGIRPSIGPAEVRESRKQQRDFWILSACLLSGKMGLLSTFRNSGRLHRWFWRSPA